MPVADHGVIDAWIAGCMPAVQPLVRAVDELIRATVDGLRYAVKWGQAHYGTDAQGWIIQVAAYHRSVNVVFFSGVDLEPPPPLGEGPRERYVKLRSPGEVADPRLRSWISQAAGLPGWR